MYTWTCINLNIVEYKGPTEVSVSTNNISINLNIVEYKAPCTPRITIQTEVLI